MQFHIDVHAMLETVPAALTGWAGVFVVTIVIIAAICLLNKATEKRG